MNRTAQVGRVVAVLTTLAAIEDQETADLARAYRALTTASRGSTDPQMQSVIVGVRSMLEATSRAAARRSELFDELAEAIGATAGMVRPLM